MVDHILNILCYALYLLHKYMYVQLIWAITKSKYVYVLWWLVGTNQ